MTENRCYQVKITISFTGGKKHGGQTEADREANAKLSNSVSEILRKNGFEKCEVAPSS